MLQLDSCLEIAKSAALLAGKYIKDHQNQDLEILLNEGRDIELQIDVDVEKIITEYLSLHSSFPILAEESGISEKLGEIYWVVDPLDGTSNFLRNIPISCISIALMTDIEPILGVIFDFNNVDLIGPAFADELIRRLNKKEKAIEVQWINSNEMIDIMMSHAVERFS